MLGEVEQAMKWRTDKTSTHVEDRRGTSSRIPGGAAGGIGGIGLIIILVAAVFLGVDPGQFIQEQDFKPGTILCDASVFKQLLHKTRHRSALLLINSGR